MRDAEELTRKVHSEATLHSELAQWSPQPPPLLWRKIHPAVLRASEHAHTCLDTVLTSDTTTLFSRVEQGCFISLWPVWWHPVEMYLWKTFSGGHNAAL